MFGNWELHGFCSVDTLRGIDMYYVKGTVLAYNLHLLLIRSWMVYGWVECREVVKLQYRDSSIAPLRLTSKDLEPDL